MLHQTTSLGNAYGVCVMFVTFFDTCMVSLTAIFVWRLSPYLVFLPWLTIACMDWAFLSSALTKVPDGAWFTIMLALILAESSWCGGLGRNNNGSLRLKIVSLPHTSSDQAQRISCASLNDLKVFLSARLKGSVFSSTRPERRLLIVFSQFTIKFTATPEIVVFFHLRPLQIPSVAAEDRHTVSRLAIPNCYRLVVRYGFNDEVITPDLASVVYEQLRLYHIGKRRVRIIADSTVGAKDDPSVDSTDDSNGTKVLEKEALSSELARIDRAFSHKVMYIFGKEQMRIKTKTNLFRKVLLQIFLWMRENTRTKMANLNVPVDKVIEVGFLKEI